MNIMNINIPITATYMLRFDGGSNPNPGPCAGAYVVYNENNEVVAEGGEFIEKGTNNIGEYTGLLIGLERCYRLGVVNIKVEGDSMLVISQVTGKWKINHQHLRVLCDKIKEMVKLFNRVTFTHIRREYNIHADQLSDQTLEKKTNWEI